MKFVYHICDWYWGKTIKIITDDGLGTIRISSDKDKPAQVMIDSFSVANEARGKGIGKQLLAEAERKTKETWPFASKIILYAEKNSWVVGWYIRNGYKKLNYDKHEFLMYKKI